MTRIVVDLPAPFGPRKPADPARLAVKVTSSTAVNAPYLLVTFSMVITGSCVVGRIGGAARGDRTAGVCRGGPVLGDVRTLGTRAVSERHIIW